MHPLAKQASENLHIDLHAALDFFVIFSRFEYALKETDYVFKGDGERNLEANFDCFAKAIKDKFDELIKTKADLKVAVEYYCGAPPKKQIWNGQHPAWAAPANTPLASSYDMLVLIRRMRNNLFHGGKGWLSPEGTSDRDKLLINYGITIIDAMISCNDDVAAHFRTKQ